MTVEELMFFDAMPQMMPVYTALREQIVRRYPDVQIRVSKTQITFKNRYAFAMASLPWRKVKGWPKEYLLVTFGLGEKREAQRINVATEPYPGRWTHHVVVQTPGEIDDELLCWIDEAYQFAANK